ncbi:glucosidase I Gls1 [Schizosaccharomyces cryophilus OY26]|uniref:Mannosyl-oligosaccharide glucosidase n=1 Tax=Schizosaccharomyces cryophilus (strain OY26 / ATCC MYA-4695 / CBS 11777 / NBRC 106824 / NRRL Y48691) TaxID=653667 RepID=S9W2B0_SCHCR|nr:glucosidase I Gls1 [Schizosaccharomyces cryophilus OY26]EPY52170.1 glucosidase I Gls1 [Schizosaccharomyces cryophilus OY26]
MVYSSTCRVISWFLLGTVFLLWNALLCHANVNAIENVVNDSLLWGPYRPNLYVGIRPKVPNSLMSGLMWANVDDYARFSKLRHRAEHGDDIGAFGWTSYDVRRGGQQVIEDLLMGIKMETEFIKLPDRNWALRVHGTPLPGAPEDLTTALFFYAYVNGEGNLELKSTSPKKVFMEGQTPDLGKFRVHTYNRMGEHPSTSGVEDLESTTMDKDYFAGFKINSKEVWQTSEILLYLLDTKMQVLSEKENMKTLDDLPPAYETLLLPNVPGGDGLQFIQKVFKGEFIFDIIFNSAKTAVASEETITKTIEENHKAFSKRFQEVFPLKYPYDENPEYQRFAEFAFANLFGNVGFFEGDSIVSKTPIEPDDEDYEFMQGFESAKGKLAENSAFFDKERHLLTAIPSRSHFPRGFYWDEGFHLLPIGLWDNDFSLEILKSWFSLVNEDGWVGREQILGSEARSKVPDEFQTQYPDIANPPTLILALKAYIERLKEQDYKKSFDDVGSDYSLEDLEYLRSVSVSNPEMSIQFLRELFPLMLRHYEWFRRTQQGDFDTWDRESFSNVEGYRWRGRTYRHCLASGLDDYPRAQPPSIAELHVDLLSWMTSFTKSLRFVAEFLGETEEAERLTNNEYAMLRNLDDLHWDEEMQTYCDASVDEYDDPKYVCHKGYVSLLPLMLGLLPPDSEKLTTMLHMIRDESELWSPYGIRSLSLNDPYFGTDENYWRGPVWMNMNYLILSSLYQNYIHVPGPNQGLAKSIYEELRINVVNTVFNNWKRTGIFWEQYDSVTGVGQRTKDFTGWTTLIVNIMSEKY